jgi:hypothetical protein
VRIVRKRDGLRCLAGNGERDHQPHDCT